MAKRWEHERIYYYDMHPTEEDLMGETALHDALARYLMDVLIMQFAGQPCAIYHNLNFYHTPDWKEYPLAPDIAVIKGVDFGYVRSWHVGTTGPAPQVVLEIASEETWKKDLRDKPGKYAAAGVEEYFAYDPNPRALGRGERRLFGWRLERATRTMRELALDGQGRLWSLHLESLLVPDKRFLRLYDRVGHLRLTQAEVQAQQKEAEARRADAGEQRAVRAERRAEAGERHAEVEAQRAERAERQAQAEARRADAEAQRAQALAEKLRSLGIDPDL